MTKKKHTPAYPTELRERGVRLFRERHEPGRCASNVPGSAAKVSIKGTPSILV